MCGIVAVVAKDVTEELVKKGIAALAQRGPDGSGVYVNDMVGLGHTHLLIMDETSGRQPLFSQDKNISVVVNGEFYGYEKIKSKLKQKGHTFSTNSDSEIIIYLYKEYGLDFVKHLRGEFAFVLYDFEQKILIAGRDRFGIKPIHFIQTKDSLYLASEAKALFAMNIAAAFNYKALEHAATMQYLLPGETLFEDISLLLPGHLLIYENNKITIKKYWDLSYPKSNVKNGIKNEVNNEVNNKFNETETINQVHKILKESVKLRLNAPQKYCCQLSGGVDSALIAALVSKFKKKNHCFTVTFPNDPFDESKKAREIAKHIGAKFTTIPLTPQKIIENLAKAIIQSEGISINSHIVGKYLLHKKMREESYKVVFTGEGADEVFRGYEHLLEDHYQKASTQQGVYGVHFSDGKELPTEEIRQKLGYVPCFLKGKASIGYKLQQLSKVMKSVNSSDSSNSFHQLLQDPFVTANLQERERLDISSQLWIHLALSGYILKTLGDGTEMAFSMEGRVPFLDHKLFEKMKNVPQSIAIKDKVAKYVLRQIAKNYLPEEVSSRTKQAFMVPPRNILFSPEVLCYLTSLIESDAFEKLGLFEKRKVLNLLENIPSMTTSEQTAHEPVIMIIVSMTILYDHYILKNSIMA